MNGAIVPIGDYPEWTPNWNSWVDRFDLGYEIDDLRLLSGSRYSMPSLKDVPFYDGGLILREDVLELYGMNPPKTFEDLYRILKAYKNDNPSSFPMTILAGPRVHYRMTQPSWGISLHLNGASGSRVLSWDYDERTYFAGATSERYRDYMRFWNRLFAEGLLDPEMADPINGEIWTRKLATGSAIATYAYYDQIGGVTAASSIPGFRLNLFPPLEGTVGAHHQPISRTGPGVVFPMSTSKRPDFEKVVRAVDQIFFSPEAVRLWTFGVEGITYTMDGDRMVFSDDIRESPDGVFKVMQLRYGAGVDVTQMVWRNEELLSKYDDNFAEINRRVGQMPNAIQYVPPAPKFSALDGERAATLMGSLFNTFLVWDDAFLTGTKSLDSDWNDYVREMEARGISELLKLYNDNVGH
jgi:putative aldouronate transport system substrate-binding protein